MVIERELSPYLSAVNFALLASSQRIIIQISHIFHRANSQNRILVVHVSVISVSIFPRTKAVKQGIISGLLD